MERRARPRPRCGAPRRARHQHDHRGRTPRSKASSPSTWPPGRGLRRRSSRAERKPRPWALSSDVGDPRRKPRQRSKKEADDTVVAGTATAISAAEATALRTEAQRTSTHEERLSNPNLLIDGPPYDHDKQDDYVRHLIESEVRRERPDASEQYLPLIDVVQDIVVHFFSSLIRTQNGPVASAILQAARSWPSGNDAAVRRARWHACALALPAPGLWRPLRARTHMISQAHRVPGAQPRPSASALPSNCPSRGAGRRSRTTWWARSTATPAGPTRASPSRTASSSTTTPHAHALLQVQREQRLL